MKALIKKPQSQKFESFLQKVLIEAEQEHREAEQGLQLMGWEQLPEELKIEIKDDIKSFMEELNGNYSSCDPWVQKRRKSVYYWVSMYRDGNVSLDTAMNALRVRPL
jgi:hypothetical protein